jgi:hypothetical protein
VQDVDRPAHVEPLPQLARAERIRVQMQPGCLVHHSECLDRIVGNRWWKRYVGQRRRPSVGSEEHQLAVGLPFYLIPSSWTARCWRRQSIAIFESVVGPPWAQRRVTVVFIAAAKTSCGASSVPTTWPRSTAHGSLPRRPLTLEDVYLWAPLPT